MRRRRVAADPALLGIKDAAPLVEAEVERARRYGRPFAMCVLSGGEQSRLPIRITDLVLRLDRDRVVVVCPETRGDDVAVLARRVSTASGGTVVGVASFPADGVTFEALLGAATRPAPMTGAAEIGSMA